MTMADGALTATTTNATLKLRSTLLMTLEAVLTAASGGRAGVAAVDA